MGRFVYSPTGKRYREPIVLGRRIMEWIFQNVNRIIQLTKDQTTFSARLRKNRQVTFPTAILKLLQMGLSSHGVTITLDELINQEVILEAKAIQYNGIWYRISSIDDKK